MPSTAELSEVVTQAATELGVVGAAVSVLYAGSEDHAFHGVTSVDNPLPVHADTIFQAGSITKTYTATAVMRLVDDGRLDLDAPVRTYLPGLVLADEDVASRVTTRHLMNHTAGWRGDFILDTGEGDDALSRYVEQMAGLDQLTPLGEATSYNNAAFNLAGHVIAQITGQTYEAAVTDLVLTPLGMHDSFFFPRPVMLRRFAVGHSERDGAQRVVDTWGLARSGNPAGGIACTTGDLLRFARLHLADGRTPDGQALLTEASAVAMRTPAGGAGAQGVGVGWSVARVGDTELATHGGSMPGQEAVLALAPGRDFAVAVMTNSAGGLQLIGRLTQWALETYLGISPPEAPTPLTLTRDELLPYEGRYDGGIYILSLAAADDHLVIDLNLTEDGEKQLTAAGVEAPAISGSRMLLLPDNHFLIADGPYGGQTGGIVRDGDGRVQALNLGRILPRLP